MTPIQQILLGAGGSTGNDPNNPTQSETLNYSTTWTAPAGITGVRVTLTGATFNAGYSNAPGMALVFNYTGTQPTTSSASAAMQAWYSAHWGAIGGSTGVRSISRPRMTSYTLNTGETVTVYDWRMRGFGTAFPAGSAANVNQSGSITINGTAIQGSTTINTWSFFMMDGIHKSCQTSIWSPGFQIYYPAGSSAPGASMFGYTAAGKTSGSANVVGPLIVSVTPGQSYSFTGGSSSNGLPIPRTLYSTNASAFLEY